jgi:hypothetical protein
MDIVVLGNPGTTSRNWFLPVVQHPAIPEKSLNRRGEGVNG